MRLADEYNAAQERAEVDGHGRPKNVPDGNVYPTAADPGLPRKQIHKTRQIRDPEAKNPRIIEDVIEDRIAAGREPARAAMKSTCSLVKS